MKVRDFSGIKNNGQLPNPEDIQLPSEMDDLLGEYIESTESQLNDLEHATLEYEAGRNREENAALIRRILHTIKGEAGIVGLDDMYELSHQAEDAFDEMSEQERTDMIFRFKDWTLIAIQKLAR
ncbi:Hpt domain-containing protein [Planctomycetota bacterium]